MTPDPFFRLGMKPAGLEADAIEALVDGDVEHVAVVANAELDVAGDALPSLDPIVC